MFLISEVSLGEANVRQAVADTITSLLSKFTLKAPSENVVC